MTTLEIQTPKWARDLLHPSRYKGAYGGRGSGKSHFFAELLIERCLLQKTDWVCIREVQKTLSQSAKKLIEQKIIDLKVGHLFEVQAALIKAPYGGQIIFQGMQDHTAESIKSLEGFDGAWIEEAQTLSQTSLDLLRPTIRKAGSELWFSWNPRHKTDAVDKMLRGTELPSGAVVKCVNWSDNPWFPDVLEQERLDCLRSDPDKYAHIWKGDYISVVEGAYYAKHLTQARAENRIGFFNRDPLLPIYAFVDIGGSSSKSDSFVFWIVQRIGLEKRAIAYYEAVGQEFSVHVNWLRNNGFGSAIIVLPHDGAKHDNVYDVTPEGFFRAAGFKTKIMKNQGMGAAMLRIEAGRRDFGNWRFNEERCQGGIDALANYHEKKDEKRNIGLGVDHDWSSHGADAFGLACVWFEINKPHIQADWDEPIRAKYNGVL